MSLHDLLASFFEVGGNGNSILTLRSDILEFFGAKTNVLVGFVAFCRMRQFRRS